MLRGILVDTDSSIEERRLAVHAVVVMYNQGLSQYDIEEAILEGNIRPQATLDALLAVQRRNELEHIFKVVWSGMLRA